MLASRIPAQRTGCLALTLCLVSIAGAEGPPPRELTLDDRVAARRAIEQVYWDHRIWPADNPAAKPPLASVLPDATIRARVEDDLRLSMLLDAYWHQPVTAAELQAELTRMTRESGAPGTLREIFAALHDDPYLIAECLARPALTRRKAEAAFANDDRVHGAQRAELASRLTAATDETALEALDGEHAEVTFTVDERPDRSVHLEPVEWQRELDDVKAAIPSGTVSGLIDMGNRFTVVAVREKSERRLTLSTVSWRKRDLASWSREMTAGVAAEPRAIVPPPAGYTASAPSTTPCTDDTWQGVTPSGAPQDGYGQRAVWTGVEMIVWGGEGPFGYMSTGGRYDPATNAWAPSSLTSGSGANVPSPRYDHTAVWTGTEMIVWGGWSYNGPSATGGRYNPATDTWAPSSLSAGSGANVPTGRAEHTAVWTGSEMIVWGGYQANSPYVTSAGGRYNPTTDTWAFSSLTTGGGANVPAARQEHTAVWTGSEMIVWGGWGNPGVLRTGGRYNPSTDSWATSSLTSGAGAFAPSARGGHAAIWTGTEMIVWGGAGPFGYLNTGGRYNPQTDAWPTSTLVLALGGNIPVGRLRPTAVWTGSEMIVWGGEYYTNPSGYFYTNTGGRYYPEADLWFPNSLVTASGANVPVPRTAHAAVWTGGSDRRMIVWGGYPTPAGGGAYCAQPCTPRTWYRDADGDGYGNAALTVSGCVRPEGYAATGDDCDDARAATHPGAAEICDGLDNDCDAATPVDGAGDALCNDANDCTSDACGPTGCVFTNTTGSCDDGNPCTSGDTCAGGICMGTPANDGGPCSDGNACSLGDYCAGGVCAPGAGAPDCDDHSVCTDDRCDRALGCVHDASQAGDLCDDGNTCTTNLCDPVLFCVFPLLPAGTACTDFDACTAGERCDDQGTCFGGVPLDCDDHNPCTDDSCDPLHGCVHANNQGPCSDTNACTQNDRCSDGICVSGPPVFCSYPDVCHFATGCDPATGACVYPAKPDGSACDDYSLCTQGETCQAGVCTPLVDGLVSPDPKTSGYYKQLCDKRARGQLPWHGDQLTQADVDCAISLSYTLSYRGIASLDDLCAVLGPGQWNPHAPACEQGEEELVATALNLCRARVCDVASLDSTCPGNTNTYLYGSFYDADFALLYAWYYGGDSIDRCGDATCELREINNGHALELNSLLVLVANHQVILSWLPLLPDDGGAAATYDIWRRPLQSGAPFVKIGTTTAVEFVDPTTGAVSWEYEVTTATP